MMDKSACYIDTSSPGVETDGRATRSLALNRLRGLIVTTCCGAAIGIAAWLTPSASGYGTHRQLGMPECSFLVQTGYPCPTCGLTTSVSSMAHGRFALAFSSHPFGVVLFSGLIVLTSAAVIETLTGRSVLSRLGKPSWWVWTLIIGIPTGWVLKLILGIADGTLPM